MSLKPRGFGFTSWLLLVGLAIAVAACSKSGKPSARIFASPDEASNALLDATKSGDQKELAAIFGPDSNEVIYSGDTVEDKKDAETFAAAYGAMHRWRKLPDGTQLLLVGADNFTLPIPLKQNGGGQWFFDTAAGKDEILSRRIGRNELAIIEVCRAVADAQAEYFSQPRDGESTNQYAAKFISDPGRQNGLYWKSPEGQPDSPLGPLVAFAAADGYSEKTKAQTPFHGYYFRMLKGQGDKAPRGARTTWSTGKWLVDSPSSPIPRNTATRG